ncbi:4-hydroxyacetophenone monooxygenase [Pleurostoma richardsiae]|uniref:4-hydroxyacetophenone monooxygenase n=1 Tax=Pleurostoma richardsiae TaxID=41990 RepID=A0AA38S1L3_9PEZI|nr:4-hydroxyacetophenone monooxygenase [Pleurostoma richardsiae]
MGSIAEELHSLGVKDPEATAGRLNAKYFPKAVPWNAHQPVKVIIVGAGIGGVATAVLLSKKVRNVTIAVYDRLGKIGGTWAANVYPGVRCDVPSHAYQLIFEPNTDWSEYYPKGAEIQAYYEKVVEKHGLTEAFHLQHEVLRATWLKEASQWAIEVRNLTTGSVHVDTADFFISSQGRISEPKHPDIPGLRDVFKGEVVHTARWPATFDPTRKRIAVIGNGASGQQLVPNILPLVSRIDHYVRTKTWVTPTFVGDLHEATADAPGGPVYTAEQRELFRNDPAAYLEHRRLFEVKLQRFRFRGDVLGSEENAALREKIIQCMLERLGGDEEWLKRAIPDYAPGCKRLTPAPGYLEALKNPKVDYVTDPISHIDKTGIVTTDGKNRTVDAIITATGFENGFTTRFPVIGKDGIDLRERWAPDGDIGFPETYLGVMAPGYPNYFTVLQAQGNARGGTVPLQIEVTATYIAKCIRKVQSQSYSSLDPRQDAVEDFNDIANGYFQGKVTLDNCNSWFKQDVLRDPRWEDFEFTRKPGAERNRYEYFGNGSTVRDVDGDDRRITYYLKEIGKIDLETVHELWNE